MTRGTYSIVAPEPETGEGVAVRSHRFSVGLIVRARPGLGAVATQSIFEVSHGPKTLELMQSCAGLADALA